MDEIDFEELVTQTETLLKTYSGKESWTDRLDSDPGITLLQALAWNVFDLSWRHTHPLRDLLTPPPAVADGREGIFGRAFGPQRALTHSPVTMNDYRRALLDLHQQDFDIPELPDSFLLRDALLLKEITEEQYHYWYDSSSYRFTFWPPKKEEGEEDRASHYHLLGGYHLWLMPERDIPIELAEQGIRDFLLNNRNIGERIRSINWLQPQALNLTIDLELEDDNYQPARVLADLFTLCENFLNPAPPRDSANTLQAQGMQSSDIWLGPALQHGWIPILNSAPDYINGYDIPLTPLAEKILSMAGVKALRTLSTGEPGWLCHIEEKHYPLLWGNNPLAQLAEGTKVRLFKRGQQLIVTPDAITQWLQKPGLLEPEENVLPFGRWRNVGRYFSASGILPPLYGLQEPEPEQRVRQLHQFLLPFEQWLSNRFAMLASLPELLSFRRSIEQPPVLWGAQWPFTTVPLVDPQAEISAPIHAEYTEELKHEAERQGKDNEHELALLDWLLGYFGRERTPRILEQASEFNLDYLQVQRGWLSEQAEIGYGGSALRIGEISAPIKRIAARLGFGAKLFTLPAPPIPEERLKDLPFYLVEHWALLPERPNEQDQNIYPVTDISDKESLQPPAEIWLTLESGKLVRGQQIDLVLDIDDRPLLVTNLVITDIDDTRAMIKSDDYISLFSNWQLIVNALTNNTLHWRVSDLWLMEKSFAYQPEEVIGDGNEAWFMFDPLPPSFHEGDSLVLLQYEVAQNRRIITFAPAFSAVITELDPLNARLLLRCSEGETFPLPSPNFVWFPHDLTRDRFSFTVSLVFNRDVIFGSESLDKNTVIRWVRQVVDEEMPCHIRCWLHWFNMEDFRYLGDIWSRWQNNGEPHGDLAYQLLSLLSLGELPPRAGGLGVMHVATATELDTYADVDFYWQESSYERMKNADVLFTPASGTAAGLAIRHIARPAELEEFSDEDANWHEAYEDDLIRYKIHYITKSQSNSALLHDEQEHNDENN
ncbi:hypothetical protein FEK66_25380 [Escherichia sp. E1130]|nr:hypothetical protein FEK66_25380 [Escherichia sp. E1130]